MLLAVVLAVWMSGLSHGANEALEAAEHLVDAGHCAHADQHPEGELDRDTEHFCFGVVHNCGCCESPVDASTRVVKMPLGTERSLGRVSVDDNSLLDGSARRIDRPPCG